MAGADQRGRLLQRIESELGACAIGYARAPAAVRGSEHRQALFECRESICRTVDGNDRNVAAQITGDGFENRPAASDKEWCQPGLRARSPCLDDDFWPDPGWITQRNRERRCPVSHLVSYSRSPRRGADRADTSAPAC